MVWFIELNFTVSFTFSSYTVSLGLLLTVILFFFSLHLFGLTPFLSLNCYCIIFFNLIYWTYCTVSFNCTHCVLPCFLLSILYSYCISIVTALCFLFKINFFFLIALIFMHFMFPDWCVTLLSQMCHAFVTESNHI